jgi:hypothetical protein
MHAALEGQRPLCAADFRRLSTAISIILICLSALTGNDKSNRCSGTPSSIDSRLANTFVRGSSRASIHDCVLFGFLISVELVSVFAESVSAPEDSNDSNR